MPAQIEIATGSVFGKWTVLELAPEKKCLCRCECGTERLVLRQNLRNGRSTNCGCEKLAKINVGDRFGMWEVQEVRRAAWQHTLCLCRCECGKESLVDVSNLTQGNSTGCGCAAHRATALRSTTHGDSPRAGKSRLYRIWNAMRTRCSNENVPHYKDYGGRGITVCKEWNSSFEEFRSWAARSGYDEQLTIERKDVNGGYHPDNCCWVPQSRQSRNRRDTKMLTAFGETKGLADWADDPRCQVKRDALRSRVYRGGWPHEEAIATPKTHRTRRTRTVV